MDDPIIVTAYDPAWSQWFDQVGRRLRTALGDQALRIDHIGSTAIAGLAAKPVLDLQISVAALDPVDAYRAAIEGSGFVWRADNSDRTKRYFREMPGTRRTHLHVRRAGSWSEQFALLFRDYLRINTADAAQYAALKIALAQRFCDDRAAYVAAKEPLIWQIMQRASAWSQAIGWQPGPPDA